MTQPLTTSTRKRPLLRRGREEEIDRLLAELRRQVAQLHRLERAARDESDLHTSRQTIAELHWRLAWVVGNPAGDGHSAAG